MSHWTLKDVGIATATMIWLYLPIIIIAAIVFIAFYVILLVAGLVSAVLYAVGGLTLLWILSLISNGKLKIPGIVWIAVPGLLFVTGYAVDHVHQLSFLSTLNIISTEYTGFQQLSLWSDAESFMLTPLGIGVIMLFIAVVAIVAVIAIKRKGK